jgi:uncharacterized RDD family membrane protein YckC
MNNNSLHFSSYQPGYGAGSAPYGAPPPGAPGPQLAGLGPRFLAYLIDSLIVGGILLVGYILMIVFAVAGAATQTEAGSTAGGLVATLVFFILFPLAIGIALYNQIYLAGKNNGQTIGKKMMKIRIVKQDGTQFGYGDAFLRNIIGYWISNLICSLGFLWILFDKQRQGWHDKIFKTYVVQA